MIYVLSKLFWTLAQPLNVVVLLVLAWPALNRLGYPRAAFISLKTGLGILVTVTILPVGQLLLIPLEDRFPQPDPLPEHIGGIIVLGGAIDSDVSAARGKISFSRSGTRLNEALSLAHRYPDARILFTGGSGDVFGHGIKEADYAQRFFADQDVAPERLIFEDDSRNTWENAGYSLKLVNPSPDAPWLLVTSAYHMPRSVGIFRRVGWPIIPDPVDYRTSDALSIRGLRFIDRLDELDVALKEWVGLVAYRILGRTDALFPGPS